MQYHNCQRQNNIKNVQEKHLINNYLVEDSPMLSTVNVNAK